MIKHVGKHGDRKVAIVFREIPGEDHMCLVVYPDVLPQTMHDSLMQSIESVEGQQAENLGDALGGKRFPDGTAQLQRIHEEGMLKKVQTAQVIVTPTPQSHVRLDEMNKIINEMKTGEEAVKRMAELDSNSGYTGKASRKDDFGREVGAPVDIPKGALNETSNPGLRNQPIAAPAQGALSDADIAAGLMQQAQAMQAQMATLQAESARLLSEAAALNPALAPKKKATTKKATTAKRGRPAKKAASA